MNNDMPLRHVLLCHCGRPLSGVPSRGKSGKYYLYYKCPTASKHNNISVIKANEQLEEVFHYLSLPETVVQEIRSSTEKILDERYQFSRLELKRMEGQLTKAADRLQSVETKYVNDQMTYDTYNRWHQDLSGQIKVLQAQIIKHSKNEDDLYSLLNKELYRLTYMRFIYQMASVPLKQQLIRQVFELKLNYSGVFIEYLR